MEKYGFIYLWYDRKRKMFYLGSHWGTIDDGYICSSNRMRDAYRRRPNDFRRRILNTNIDRQSLLDVEHKWLSMIDESELGKKYYNLRQHKWGHWSVENNLPVREKLKKAWTDERKEKARQLQLERASQGKHNFADGNKTAERNRQRRGLKRPGQTKALSRKWIVTHPTGEKEEIVNLKHYCKEKCLHYPTMTQIAKGLSFGGKYRGFVVEDCE